MVTEKVRERRSCIAVRQQTKNALDSVKHPGQSYDGVIQEVIKFWKKEHGLEETVQVSSPVEIGQAG